MATSLKLLTAVTSGMHNILTNEAVREFRGESRTMTLRCHSVKEESRILTDLGFFREQNYNNRVALVSTCMIKQLLFGSVEYKLLVQCFDVCETVIALQSDE